MDQETAMTGRAAMDWAVQNSVSLRFKAPRQKVWLVERHNEIIRQALHRTEEQMKKELEMLLRTQYCGFQAKLKCKGSPAAKRK